MRFGPSTCFRATLSEVKSRYSLRGERRWDWLPTYVNLGGWCLIQAACRIFGVDRVRGLLVRGVRPMFGREILGSNQLPSGYEPDALPNELISHVGSTGWTRKGWRIARGVERCLQNRCVYGRRDARPSMKVVPGVSPGNTAWDFKASQQTPSPTPMWGQVSSTPACGSRTPETLSRLLTDVRGHLRGRGGDHVAARVRRES